MVKRLSMGTVGLCCSLGLMVLVAGCSGLGLGSDEPTTSVTSTVTSTAASDAPERLSSAEQAYVEAIHSAYLENFAMMGALALSLTEYDGSPLTQLTNSKSLEEFRASIVEWDETGSGSAPSCPSQRLAPLHDAWYDLVAHMAYYNNHYGDFISDPSRLEAFTGLQSEAQETAIDWDRCRAQIDDLQLKTGASIQQIEEVTSTLEQIVDGVKPFVILPEAEQGPFESAYDVILLINADMQGGGGLKYDTLMDQVITLNQEVIAFPVTTTPQSELLSRCMSTALLGYAYFLKTWRDKSDNDYAGTKELPVEETVRITYMLKESEQIDVVMGTILGATPTMVAKIKLMMSE